MSNFDLAVLAIGGLWLFSRCCVAVQASRYHEIMDQIELRYKDGVDAKNESAADEHPDAAAA